VSATGVWPKDKKVFNPRMGQRKPLIPNEESNRKANTEEAPLIFGLFCWEEPFVLTVYHLFFGWFLKQ
jgi:hypothetical protein